MKTLRKIKIAAGILAVAIIAVSCIEGIVYDELGDAGQTIIKLNPASSSGFFKAVADPIGTPQTFPLLDIRRDAPSESALNSTTTVTLQFDQGIMDAYNTANGTNLIPIPPADYSTTPASSGNSISVVFGPGEFVSEVLLTIPNALNLDPGNQYGLAYKMSVTGGSGILSATSSDSIVVQLIPKNFFEGEYDAHILYYHPSQGTYPDNLNVDKVNTKYLATLDGTTCSTWFAVWSGYEAQITINPDNSIGFWVTPDWGIDVLLGNPEDPTEVSYYDPATKTIQLYYHYLGGSGYRIFKETYTLK